MPSPPSPLLTGIFGALAVLATLAAAGCSPGAGGPAADGGAADLLAAVQDDHGSYEVWTAAGALSHYRVLSSTTGPTATVTFPNPGFATFKVTLDDGGELAIADDRGAVAVTLRDPALQALIGTDQFSATVSSGPRGSTTHSLFTLFQLLIDPATQPDSTCSSSTNVLDTFCLLIGLLEVDALGGGLNGSLPAAGSIDTAAGAPELLNRYVDPLKGFCSSWGRYRDTVNPCDIDP